VTEALQNEWHEILTGEMMLLGLLSRIFYNYPDKKERLWLQSLIAEDVFSEAPFASQEEATRTGLQLLQDWGRQGLMDQAFDDLQGDYTRLFIGPGSVIAPPWESVYFSDEKLTFQEQTLEVRSWYRRFGLEAEKLHQEPDDHIALELLFLSHLASLGLQALEQQDTARFDELLTAQSEFYKKHPSKWVLKWSRLVETNARTDFYKGLSHLVRGAMSGLAETLHTK
jgi:TorA maturation chaperone TorD